MDISSSFFIIPIDERGRYKTAFWLNDLAYEFNVLVMGLKSSLYHLNKFIEKVFNDDAYDKFSKDLSISERKLLPGSFRKIIKTYFDDTFIFADNYNILYVVIKLVLIVSWSAKIKFSIEKCTFFTQKIKILGYF